MDRARKNKTEPPFTGKIILFLIVIAVLSCKERDAPVIGKEDAKTDAILSEAVDSL
ncbi:hypothetical protein PSM36_1448 [Proteiniphilum saccharofermentans]|uniref:Uncharacterized protein n=1 Tax=Proteiniphilum saccharofermentans TaxID=1642647 RepID=A0A1R3SZD8_9BACT|nr:hypothetical protein [Proteiniphilum saccharofermentans]SCD20270.1 hypothetical protein PSM36_1448 [Proteiniphilum saccharofermentans]